MDPVPPVAAGQRHARLAFHRHAQHPRQRPAPGPEKAVPSGLCRGHGRPPRQRDTLEALGLARALSRLPEDQRAAVLLIGLEDMSYAEAAKILAVPIGTVRSRLARGRERLRRLMTGDGPEVVKGIK